MKLIYIGVLRDISVPQGLGLLGNHVLLENLELVLVFSLKMIVLLALLVCIVLIQI